ncbi:MAG: Fe-S cluster domain-containing protein [Pseudomonadota bacterium]
MEPVLIKTALIGLITFGTIGLVFGLGLALAAAKFAVQLNPKVEAVKHVLPGANCGGCGFAGCEDYAENVVNNPNVPPNKCFPGKAAVAAQVARLTGKEMAAVEAMVAVPRCSRIKGNVSKRCDYLGHNSCAGAAMVFGGPLDCRFACIGLGDCVNVCPFGAITIENGFPVVNDDLCVGCGSCAKVCPKGVLSIVPRNARVLVACNSQESGKAVMGVCDAGCISCGMCEKKCPAKAITIKDNRVIIDYAKCLSPKAESCDLICVKSCKRGIMQPFRGIC